MYYICMYMYKTTQIGYVLFYNFTNMYSRYGCWPLGIKIEEPTWNQIASPSNYNHTLIFILKLIVHVVLDIGDEKPFKYCNTRTFYYTEIVKIRFLPFLALNNVFSSNI